MIKLKDLQNRVYSGSECIRFEYEFEANEKQVIAYFEKMDNKFVQPNGWKMQIILERTRDKDSEVYNFIYVMPKSGLPLALIAATGLKYFQLHIKEEVQTKSNMDFELGRILEGM